MSFQEIFDQYAHTCVPWKGFSKELLEAILAEPQEAADYILNYLEKALQDPEVASLEDEEYQELMCALAIATGLKDTRAFPLVLRFAQSELADGLMGDLITELYPDMIARTFNGDIDALVRCVADESTDEFGAEAILIAMGVMYRNGILPRGEYESFMDKVFDAQIENPTIMTGAVSSIIESGDDSLAYRIEEVKDRGLLLRYVVGSVRECQEDLLLGHWQRELLQGDLERWMKAYY